MKPARTWLPENLQEENSEANNDANEVSVHGRSGQHASHGEENPFAVRSRVHCQEMTRLLPDPTPEAIQAVLTPQVRYMPSAPASDPREVVLTAVKTLSVMGRLLLQPRLSRSEGKSAQGGRGLRNGRCRHASTLPITTANRSSPARTGGRKMRAIGMEDSTPSSSRRFGTDATNQCGTGDVSGEAPRSPKGKLGRCNSVSGQTKGGNSAGFSLRRLGNNDYSVQYTVYSIQCTVTQTERLKGEDATFKPMGVCHVDLPPHLRLPHGCTLS